MAQPRSPGPETTAVVVTCGTTRYLRRTLEGLSAQTLTPTRVVVVDIWSSGRDVGTGHSIQSIVTEIGLDALCKVRVLQAPEARTFGEAVRQGLELNTRAQQRADKLHETRTGEIPIIRDDTSPGWLWLLHDDSAPDPEALGHLLRKAESGPSIAVAGAKQRDWAQSERLLEVGIFSTGSARRYNPIDTDEIDQGQHDGVEDVLAVGLAGALVRRDVWNRLGGTDPALGPFGDGLEFCRRARLAGYRVEVVPRAVVYHARASYLGLRSYGHANQRPQAPDTARSFGARRRAQLYNWVVATPWYLLPPLLVWLIALTPARALVRFAQKDMVRARAELSAGAAVLSRPDLWLAARARLKKTSTLPGHTLASLETDAREIKRKKREQRRSRSDAHRLIGAPSELEISERATLARRRRVAAAVIAVGATAVAGLGLARLLGVGALAGGALLPGDVGLTELAATASSWWIPAGDGVAGPADPFLTVALAPLLTGISLSTLTTLTVFLAVPAAALTAWFAAGAATRSVGLRAWAAVMWAFAPVALFASGQGRVAPLAAHIVLPLVALLMARAMGAQRRDVILSGLVGAQRVIDPTAHPRAAADAPATHPPALTPSAQCAPPQRPGSSLGSAAGAGLAFAAVAAGAPALLPAGVLVFVGLTLFAHHRRVLWFIPVPALVLFGPYLTTVVAEGSWHALAASPGVPLAFEAAEPWLVSLGIPASVDLSVLPPWVPWLALAPGALLALLAVLALGRGTMRARAVRVGWVVALLGLVTALAAPRVAVALDPTGAVVRGWPGAGISLMTLGLLLAVLAAGDGLPDVLSRHQFGWRHISAGSLAALAVASAAVAPGVWVLGMRGPVAELHQLEPARDNALPALAEQVRGAPERARTLALEVLPDGSLEADVWRSRGEQFQFTSTLASARDIADPLTGLAAVAPDAAAAALADVVAAMAAGSATDTGARLAEHAIAVVLVPPAVDAGVTSGREALIAQLDATPGLARVTENESGVVWRVATDGREAAAEAIARVRLLDPEGTALTTVPSGIVTAAGELSAGTAGRVLVLAERADPWWLARVDGELLEPVDRGWQQAFAVPAGSGAVTVTHNPPLRVPWLLAQVLVGAATIVLAAPVRRRREVE